MMITPPMLGSITLSIKASFISSWPTIALNGKTIRSLDGQFGSRLVRFAGLRRGLRRLVIGLGIFDAQSDAGVCGHHYRGRVQIGQPSARCADGLASRQRT